MANPYMYPEELGLIQLVQVDYSDGCYCFDYRIIWKHEETGDLYTARDSGCSCPCPFENYNSLKDLDILCKSEIVAEARDESKNNYSQDNLFDFIKEVEAI